MPYDAAIRATATAEYALELKQFLGLTIFAQPATTATPQSPIKSSMKPTQATLRFVGKLSHFVRLVFDVSGRLIANRVTTFADFPPTLHHVPELTD